MAYSIVEQDWMENVLSGSSLFLKYMLQSSPYNDECKNCSVFPLCDGGCSLYRFRNNFNGTCFDLCTPLKDLNKLKHALLHDNLTIRVAEESDG